MNEFDTFYKQNVRLVYAMALARGIEPRNAEDLTQETFLRAWRHSGLLFGLEGAAQRAWLVRTLRNLTCDAWRLSRPSVCEPPVTDDLYNGPEERAALRLDVTRALAELGEQDREVVVLRYFSQMNSREIGEALDMPEGTVRRKLMECRKHLAERLAPWEPVGEQK